MTTNDPNNTNVSNENRKRLAPSFSSSSISSIDDYQRSASSASQKKRRRLLGEGVFTQSHASLSQSLRPSRRNTDDSRRNFEFPATVNANRSTDDSTTLSSEKEPQEKIRLVDVAQSSFQVLYEDSVRLQQAQSTTNTANNSLVVGNDAQEEEEPVYLQVRDDDPVQLEAPHQQPALPSKTIRTTSTSRTSLFGTMHKYPTKKATSPREQRFELLQLLHRLGMEMAKTFPPPPPAPVDSTVTKDTPSHFFHHWYLPTLQMITQLEHGISGYTLQKQAQRNMDDNTNRIDPLNPPLAMDEHDLFASSLLLYLPQLFQTLSETHSSPSLLSTNVSNIAQTLGGRGVVPCSSSKMNPVLRSADDVLVASAKAVMRQYCLAVLTWYQQEGMGSSSSSTITTDKDPSSNDPPKTSESSSQEELDDGSTTCTDPDQLYRQCLIQTKVISGILDVVKSQCGPPLADPDLSTLQIQGRMEVHLEACKLLTLLLGKMPVTHESVLANDEDDSIMGDVTPTTLAKSLAKTAHERILQTMVLVLEQHCQDHQRQRETNGPDRVPKILDHTITEKDYATLTSTISRISILVLVLDMLWRRVKTSHGMCQKQWSQNISMHNGDVTDAARSILKVCRTFANVPTIQQIGLSLVSWLVEDNQCREYMLSIGHRDDEDEYATDGQRCALTNFLANTMKIHAFDSIINCNAAATLCWLIHAGSITSDMPNGPNRGDFPQDIDGAVQESATATGISPSTRAGRRSGARLRPAISSTHVSTLLQTAILHFDNASVFGNAVCVLCGLTPATVVSPPVEDGEVPQEIYNEVELFRVILKGMVLHMSSPKVQESSLRWIRFRNSATSIERCLPLFKKTIPLIVKGMNKHPENMHFIAQACDVLAFMSDISDLRDPLLRSGAVDCMLRAVRVHKHEARIQQYAIWFLSLLLPRPNGGIPVESSTAFGGSVLTIQTIWDGMGLRETATAEEDDDEEEEEDTDDEIEFEELFAGQME